MGKNTLSLRRPIIPERAVRAAPENTARALTPAEDQARSSLMAIAFAEAQAKIELEARAKA